MKWVFTILLCLFLSLPVKAYAQSSYVLPYPSDMPGSRFYKAQLLIERVSKLWYFGNFGSFKYSLKNSDKYLVEAKTLLEYNQFLLANNSLIKSNDYFSDAPRYLEKAKIEGKDISSSKSVLDSAREKHIEVLTKLKKEVPATVIWKPENEKPTDIKLHLEIDESIALRSETL